jgi:hypothetical protein
MPAANLPVMPLPARDEKKVSEWHWVQSWAVSMFFG